MFGKVPPSNAPGLPATTTTGSISSTATATTAASAVSSAIKSSCARPTGTTCLPCFSSEEPSTAAGDDRPKAWKAKDNAGCVIVSEAPCNTVQPVVNMLLNSATLLSNSLSSSLGSTSPGECVRPSRNLDSSASSSLCTKAKYSSKDSPHAQAKNYAAHCTNNSSSSSTVHKCSSNPNCPSVSSTKAASGVTPARSQRVLASSSLSNLSADHTALVELSKVLKKHQHAASREFLAGREQLAQQCVAANKSISRIGSLTSSKASARSPEPPRRCSASGKGRPSIDADEPDESSAEHSFSASFSTMTPAAPTSSASASASASSSSSSFYSSVSQPSPASDCQKPTSRAGKDNAGELVDVPHQSTSSTCAERASCRGDYFASSTPSKERATRGGETCQQNCISCMPQDLPTELQSSSPRSYKDREKCRDTWRPTEMESNLYGLNVCQAASEVVQDTTTGSKRRTGASCQALRHAVASLNRLDDFYMEKIGAGFFSEVFKVTHKVTSQVMVLKMNQLPANRPNMLKEVQLMNKLSHPNILRFMGVCVHEGQLHALTEYINGGSLEQLIMARHTPLPHTIRMNLARDVSRGMAYLHSRGIFHRDLTSKNVLIKKDESSGGELTAVVGDFGLAAKIPDPSSGYRLSTVGSPYWMSPECLKGQWYDHRSDVFSFGIVVCELIGRVPADPDVLPRSDNFGLDYLAVAEICAAADPPPAFLQLAFNCCTYEPKSRPTFPEIISSLDSIIASYEDESKNGIGKRQSADPALMSSMDEIVREGRGMKRKTARLRSQSADAGGGGSDNATPSDKARCHSARRVAELASRRDPHYRPMTANPFHALGGVKKILGDLFSSCLELPSLEDVRPSVTDGGTKFKPAQNDSIAKILDRKKPSSEPSSPTARKKWERKVATKVGAASLFAHPLFRDGWEPRRRGSCESGFWSCVGEDLSPEPPNRRHTSTLSSSAASSLFMLDDHRTSSIYTDSSEDIASLGGGDSSCWEDRLSGIGSSSKTISKIVEYFERKQATAGNLRLGDHEAGPSRITLLRASLEGPVPLCSISAAQRLVVCEGAVRSKLPLFDKK